MAEHGHAAAQYNMGVLYDEGRGVTQDYREAAKWYELAAVQGNDLALKLRDFAATHMTSTQIDAAQAMAQRCLASTYRDCGG